MLINQHHQSELAGVFSLQVTFAVKGSEFTALPWLVYEAITTQGVDIFTNAAEVP